MNKINLNKISTDPPKKYKKEGVKKDLRKLKNRLGELQNLLYAQDKRSLLVVLQGLDCSGKDGAIKNVFDPMNPMGCRVYAFKKPNDHEMKYDFLWRIHRDVPPKGMIHIFNRSHYEDVVAQKVHHWVTPEIIEERYRQINDFERMLTENGTVILKFYLHISKEEQLKRLNERLQDPAKMWKYNENDLKEREFWKEYRGAYEKAMERCSEYADWYVVPADHNWYKEYFIAKIVVDTLEAMKLHYPGMKAGE